MLACILLAESSISEDKRAEVARSATECGIL